MEGFNLGADHNFSILRRGFRLSIEMKEKKKEKRKEKRKRGTNRYFLIF